MRVSARKVGGVNVRIQLEFACCSTRLCVPLVEFNLVAPSDLSVLKCVRWCDGDDGDDSK